jgi:hypothetical protein
MSLINLIVAIRKAFPEWQREQAYADLMALDDHTLADTGLRHSDLATGHYQKTQVRDAAPARQTAPRQRPAVPEYFAPF